MARRLCVLSLLFVWGKGATHSIGLSTGVETLPALQENLITDLEANARKYPPGLLVTTVIQGSLADQAGLKVGDVVLSLDGVEIRFVSQIIPLRDKARWDHKKTVPLIVKRGVQKLELTLMVAPLWGFQDRPPLPAIAEKLYVEVTTLPAVPQDERKKRFQAAAEAATKTGDDRAAAWLWNMTSAEKLPDAKSYQDAYIAGLQAAEHAGDSLLTALFLNRLGVTAYESGPRRAGEAYLTQALALREHWAPSSLDLAVSLHNQGYVAYHNNDRVQATSLYQRALVIREQIAPDSLDLANTLNNMGDIAFDYSRINDAEALYKRAWAIYEHESHDSLDAAVSLANLGRVAYRFSHFDEAKNLYQRALAIRQHLAPDSLAMASSFVNLGAIACDLGELDEADKYYKQARIIIEQKAPESLDMSDCLNNLGNVAYKRSNLEEAQEDYEHALAMREHKAPHSLRVAETLDNLWNLAFERGQLDQAAKYSQDALAIQQVQDSPAASVSLNNLGNVAFSRGRFEEAQDLYQRALVIDKHLPFETLNMATTLHNLGNIARAYGKRDEAEEYYRQALSIRQHLVPNSLAVAASLNNLGLIADDRSLLTATDDKQQRSQLDVAEGHFKHALAILERLSPHAMDTALCLNNLSTVAFYRKNLPEAEDYGKRALAITQRFGPASLTLAAGLYNLGRIALNRNRPDEAEQNLRRAWQIVQAQGREVAGDQGRQEFGAANIFYTATLIAVELQQHKTDAAFLTLEEGRAQALMQSLAERNLTQNITPAAIWQAYQTARTNYNIAFKAAEVADSGLTRAQNALKMAQQERLKASQLTESQQAVTFAEQAFEKKHVEEIQRQAEVENAWVEVKRADQAAVPQPLDLTQARKRLPAGTLVLEFSVREEAVVLFAITAAGIKTAVLEPVPAELRAWDLSIRRQVAQDTDGRSALANTSEEPIDPRYGKLIPTDTVAMLRQFYAKLFPKEVQAAIRHAKRVVISPDDFLWDLPFGALVTNKTGKPIYLAQQKPLSYTQSLGLSLHSVPANPARASTRIEGTEVLVVGNPLYDNARRSTMLADARKQTAPTGKIANKTGPSKPPIVTPPKTTQSTSPQIPLVQRNGELGMLTPTGVAPLQLDYAQQEAEWIALLYHASAHVGVEPTEAWFRQQVENARIIHLATHGFLHPFAAQSSGVLLAVPEVKPEPGQYDNDGALQAWEVWSLNLKADLVVLSACETGRGTKMTGEGLIGLTRAWQYAGAKTVVSSLWKVSDASTATLMTAFHKYLLAGKEKDEALRLAMLETAASKQRVWSDPHFWAAFVLVGNTGRLR